MVERDHSGAATGAGTGQGLAALWVQERALLAGLGLMAIPGVGPVVAAGWLVATAVGAEWEPLLVEHPAASLVR